MFLAVVPPLIGAPGSAAAKWVWGIVCFVIPLIAVIAINLMRVKALKTSAPPTWVTLPLRTVAPLFLSGAAAVLSVHAFEDDPTYAVKVRRSVPRFAGLGTLFYVVSMFIGWLWDRFHLPGWTWRGFVDWLGRCTGRVHWALLLLEIMVFFMIMAVSQVAIAAFCFFVIAGLPSPPGDGVVFQVLLGFGFLTVVYLYYVVASFICVNFLFRHPNGSQVPYL